MPFVGLRGRRISLQMLEAEGCRTVDSIAFPRPSSLYGERMWRIDGGRWRVGRDGFVTTEKDAVKLTADAGAVGDGGAFTGGTARGCISESGRCVA